MSNWLFKHDLNAETISQFGYVWVKFRPKYWQVMIKNEVMLGLYKIKKANRLCLFYHLNTFWMLKQYHNLDMFESNSVQNIGRLW